MSADAHIVTSRHTPGSLAVRRVRPRTVVSRALLTAIGWTAGFVVIAPLLWMVISSLKPEMETYVFPPTLWPTSPTSQAYRRLFTETVFFSYLRNSFVVAVVVTCAVISLSLAASYALVRFKLPGAEWLVRLTLFSYTMPTLLLVVPIVQIFMTIHLVNSLPSLMVVYTGLYLPLGIWILRSYFIGLSPDPEEAAMTDGATRFQAFYIVAVPQALPGIISVAVFTFNAAWNEYLYASMLIQDRNLLTLSAGLATFIGEVSMYSWAMLMAAGCLTVAPILLMFLFLQRYLVSGLGAGAVKG